MTDPEDDIRELYVAIERQFHPAVAWAMVRIAALLGRARRGLDDER